MSRNRLYLLIGTMIAAGYGWLAYAWDKAHQDSFTPCLFKNVTGIACPSCGTTRSVLHIAKGHFAEAILINPLGLLMAALMVILPVWIVYDLAFKKSSLYNSYRKFEAVLKIKWIAILLAILIILNWIWNIQKGL
jgi:Protein of unknown function (DUF2752)